MGVLLGCAAGEPAREPEPSVPLCAPIGSLAPLPEPAACGDDELAEYEASLAERIVPHAKGVLVRAELDDQARVAEVCVDSGPGYGPGRARRALGERLDAIRALPPGPACVARKRIDLNRYEAKWAEIRERESRCQEQSRVTRETHGTTAIRGAESRGKYGVYDREFERCMEHQADWIVLDQPGSTRPAIFVKPEIPDPPGASVYDAESRCTRKHRGFEERATCIEAEGFERLTPPPR